MFNLQYNETVEQLEEIVERIQLEGLNYALIDYLTVDGNKFPTLSKLQILYRTVEDMIQCEITSLIKEYKPELSEDELIEYHDDNGITFTDKEHIYELIADNKHVTTPLMNLFFELT